MARSEVMVKPPKTDILGPPVDQLQRVADGSRTRDRRDHNAELYQLSYSHLAGSNLACGAGGWEPGRRRRNVRQAFSSAAAGA